MVITEVSYLPGIYNQNSSYLQSVQKKRLNLIMSADTLAGFSCDTFSHQE